MAERAALVTGASGGIGGALAAALAREGFDLTLCGRDEGRLEALAARLRSEAGHTARWHAADLRDVDTIHELVAGHEGAFGRLDALVQSAGGGIMARLESIEPRHVDRQLDLNLRSAILLFRACLPLLLAAGRAHVVHVSSAAGKQGQPGLAVYSAAKAGLIGFTEACNRDYGSEGIRSTVFCPGLVDTPLAAAYDTPPEEMIRPDDLGEALRFLLRLSDRCLVPELSFLAPEGRFGDD